MSTPQEKNPLADRFEGEIGSESRQLYEKLMDHWQVIAASAVAVLLLTAGYGGYSAYQERRMTQAQEALTQAVLEFQGAQRVAALEELQGDLPKAMLPRFWLESAKAAAQQEDWDKALQFWKMLSEGGSDTWALLARMGQSTALLHLGRPQEALAELDRLHAQAPESMRPVVLQQVAEAAEMAENWERAVAAYEELRSMEDLPQPGFLDFKLNEIRQRLAADVS